MLIKLQLILLIFNNLNVISQCNCDHTISGLSNSSVNIINATSFSYAPGDTFCIDADSIAGLRFIGFNGTAGNPLTFVNCNGQVIISENTYSGIAFSESNFIHITGTGDSNNDYGFHIIKSGGGQMGIAIGYLSSDFELDHVEIENTGFAGIMAKTDPKCNDPATWRSNGYIFKNLIIHNNYIHDTGGEGMYIGNSGGFKVVSNVTCNGDYIFGHWLENVDVHHNLLVNTGWDAIQLSLVRSNGKIHDNRIINHGQEGVTYQDFAMSIGGGEYEIYNNFVLVDPGNYGKGMQMISGQSGSSLYNNVFINPHSHGMFIHNRHEFEDTVGYVFINNTIINPELSGIFYNTGITQSLDSNLIGDQQNQVPSYFINNFIANPGSDYGNSPIWKAEQECYFDFNAISTRDSQLSHIFSNLMTRQIDTLDLIDTISNNYSSDSSVSPLFDAGVDVSSYGVIFDINNLPRPQSSAFDIGAYEYSLQTEISEIDRVYLIYPNPTSTTIQIKGLNQPCAYQVFNLNGKCLKQGEIVDFLYDNYIDISTLESGFLFIKIDHQILKVIKI